MVVNKTIFKAYDIRGIYPEELNEETAFLIGRAFAFATGVKKIAVGRDMRLGSAALFEALVKGINSKGADVYNLGQVPVECVYFSVGKGQAPAGIMITASHNPKEYNGFKIVKKGRTELSDRSNPYRPGPEQSDRESISASFGASPAPVAAAMARPEDIEFVSGKDIQEMVEKFNNSSFEKNTAESPAAPARIFEVDIWQDYLNHILSFADVKTLKSFKAAIDAGNGMAGKVIPLIAKMLPLEIFSLNFELNGNFPNHPSNPLSPGATAQISQEVVAQKADFGFIFDGDADRVYLIDEKGKFVSADITLLMLAKYLLEKNPGAGIAYNAVCSKAVPEFIKKWGGKPIRTKVGFVNVREGMMTGQGIMGGELSGHYSFKDNFYMDSSFIAFLILLQVFSRADKKVSEIVKELDRYYKAPEINFATEKKDDIIYKIKNRYTGKQDNLDGITIEYSNWWFNLRPSNTEPLLRLTIEADTEELLQEKKKELSEFIKKES